jgi:GTPase Era involved in 16S rRNA processing
VELVREKLYRRLNQELPYRLNVVLQAAQSTPDGAGLHIRVGVEVRNKLMKSIVIGRRGDVIQRYVTLPTQAELCRVLGQPVKLLVSVRALQD